MGKKFLAGGLHFIFIIVIALLIGNTATLAQTDSWTPVRGAEKLRSLMSGTEMEWEEPDGGKSRGIYRADGTGILYSWGGEFPRTWEVRGDDLICVTASRDTQCWQLEKHSTDPTLYGARDVTTGRLTEIRIAAGKGTVEGDPKDVGNKGGGATASADEVAAQLSNPNTPLASLTFKFQFRTLQGDLPKADDQESGTLLFQPVLPFPLANGDLVLFRPAVPLLIAQPVFDVEELDFDSHFGLGDISFDLAYARTTKTGILMAGGLVVTMPTPTKDELGPDRWTLGPELLIGKLTKTYVLGAFPNHQWDIGGSGEADISLTSGQVFGIYLPGGGWNIGTQPIISYNHEIDEWTIPLNATIGKTVILNGRPWKFAMEINYFVAQTDAFGPEWFVGLNVTPVVENMLASWIK